MSKNRKPSLQRQLSDPGASALGARDAALRDDTKARQSVADEAARRKVDAVTNDSFFNFQMKLGIGTDNPMSTGSYGFNPITRNRQLLEWIHRGSWIGGVAIDVVAQDMTRRGVEVLSEMPSDDVSSLEKAATEMKIWDQIRENTQWARLYGGSICVALVDGHDPRDPLDLNAVGPDAFKGLLTLDRWMIEPSVEDLVTEYGPNLGLPKYYRVMSNAPALRGKAIHYSRVMFRQIGVNVPYQQRLIENLWGISVIERLYDRMVSFDSATTGAAQLVYKAYLRTLSVEGMRDIVSAGGPALKGLTSYVDTMRRFQGIEGMSIIDAKDKLEVQGTNAFGGLADALTQFGQQLSGALQIPLVRLFGQSPSGMNSSGESDLRTYYDHIASEQSDQLSVGVHKVYKLLAVSRGILIPPDFKLGFKSLWELSDQDKAEIAGKVVTAVSGAHESGLISDKTAMQELRQSARTTGIFTNITQDDIELASSDITPPVPELPPGFDPMNGGTPNDQQGPTGAPGEVDPSAQGGAPVLKPAAPSGPAGGVDRQGPKP